MLFNEVRHECEITFISRWYKIGTQSESEKYVDIKRIDTEQCRIKNQK